MESLFSEKVTHGDPNNLVKIADNLKGLTDRALIEMQQSPASFAPAYMIDAEMQRRKKLRDSGQVMAGHGGSTNVRTDLSRAFKEKYGGLASLPGLQKAEGGVIPSYSNGRLISAYYPGLNAIINNPNLTKKEKEEIIKEKTNDEVTSQNQNEEKTYSKTMDDPRLRAIVEKNNQNPIIQALNKVGGSSAPSNKAGLNSLNTNKPKEKPKPNEGGQNAGIATNSRKNPFASLTEKLEKRLDGIQPLSTEDKIRQAMIGGGLAYARGENLGQAGTAGFQQVKQAEKLNREQRKDANKELLDLTKSSAMFDLKIDELGLKAHEIDATIANNYAKNKIDAMYKSKNLDLNQRKYLQKNKEIILSTYNNLLKESAMGKNEELMDKKPNELFEMAIAMNKDFRLNMGSGPLGNEDIGN